MLPSTSTSQHTIFDAADRLVSFLDFFQELENSPEWVGISAFLIHWEHVVPTHLYGSAMRYYETLDPDCQQDWPQLRDTMARRFPGAIRSGALIRRSTTQWDEYCLPTPVESPPVSIPVVEELEIPDAREGSLEHKRYSLSLSTLKGRLRMPSFSRSLSPTETLREPYVIVQSMFIEYAHGGTNLNPIYTTTHVSVDLTDPQAVAAAKRDPLITIPSSDDNDRYRVGFTYIMLRGQRSVDFCHKVLAPRRSKIDYFRQTGDQTVSPTPQLFQSFPITNFIHEHKDPNYSRKKSPPGTYTIQSHLRSRTPQIWMKSDMEHVGEITWILQVI